MIKREHIKQAIEAISRRDAHIGYSLDEMLAMGMIDVPDRYDGDRRVQQELYFLFEGQKVRINRILYFNEGTVPIEQRLLVKYGELVKKQELQDEEEALSYEKASREIHAAGLRLMVTYELDYAIDRLNRLLGAEGETTGEDGSKDASPRKDRPESSGKSYSRVLRCRDLIEYLEAIKRDPLSPEWDLDEADAAVLFHGLVDNQRRALFLPLPISMDGLMQVADINLEFFHVRFVLECLVRGLEKNLFACVVGRKIVGLIYVIHRYHLFGRDLEIRFLASLRGRPGDGALGARPLRGIGTFLVAGIWMLWKQAFPRVRRLSLDAEVGARRFYESLGFHPTGSSGYYLERPRGYLLRAILDMARHCPDLEPRVVKEIEKNVGRQVGNLRKRERGGSSAPTRNDLLSLFRECMSPETRPEFAKSAVSALLKYRKRIPESDELIRFGLINSSEEIRAYIQYATRISTERR